VGDDPIDAEVEPRRRISALDVLCVGGIVVGIIRAWVTLAFVPKLLGTHPVLLEMLRGSTSSMVTAGAFARDGRASLVAAIAAGVLGLGFFSVFYWWAGRRYGNRVLAFYTQRNPRYERWVERSESFLARWGGLTLIVQYFQPIPNVLLYIGTGAAGLPLWQFVICNTIGCLLWVGLAVGLGYSIGHPAVHVAQQISHYSLYVTIGLVVVVMVYAGWRASRDAQRAESTGSSETAGEEQRDADDSGGTGHDGTGIVEHATDDGTDGHGNEPATQGRTLGGRGT
jgi:membrane protein DedA with SNARE-associated domain